VIPEHVKKSIDAWFDKSDEATFYERIVLQQEAVEAYANEPFAIRYGHILEHILKHMTVVIKGGERIVGSVVEIIPTAEQRAYAEALSKEWWGPEVSEEDRQRQVSYYFSPGWVKRRNPVFFSLGHLAYDWETLIGEGLGWYTEKVESMLEERRFAEDEDKTNFLKGALVAYGAHTDFILRYADKATELAGQASDPEERTRLEAVAESCRHVATGSARTLQEALQLIWLVVLVSQKTAGCGVFNFSRMDQYLLPLFNQDIESGRLTEQDALGLIIEFYNKNNEIMFPADHMSQEHESVIKNLEVTYDDPNYLIVGGKLDPNTSGVNALSHLFIQAASLLRLKNPFVVVRWHEGVDRTFWHEVIEAMRKNATVVVYNDETMIPALLEFGVDEQDVYSYGFYGCNDPNIPALEGGLRQLWMNLVWPYELALNGGRPFAEPERSAEGNFGITDRIQIGLMSGPYVGKRFDADAPCPSMEVFMERYRAQMSFLLDQYREIMEKDYELEAECNKGRIRIEDLFLRGTIDEATTWLTGGTKYHKVTLQGSGLATAVDSLAAIDIAVFKEKRYTLKELREAIAANYEGYEEMRTYLSRLPKFGNDLDMVDEYAKIVVDTFADAVVKMNRERKGLYTYMPTISTDRDFTAMGRWLAASADGRLAGEPISENQSPYIGADKSGMTALLNSVSIVPFNRIAGGPLNLRLHPSTVEGNEGLDKLASLMEVYLRKGGLQAQMNVVGRAELIEAQKHPEKYKNLCVRVVGYAAYFVQMGKKAQNELIQRTEL
jgi:formate C-acetyltransferase